MTDTLAHTKYCSACSSPFEIVAEDILFYEKISPTFAGQRFQIPPPSLCPDCRQQRRLSFRNERSLYKRKCDASGKDIISIYSPDKDYKVYDQKIWRSDDRDPLQYGREFDFTKTFSEQFGEMLHDVPFMAIMNDS
ncbi:MAG: hypothetical protein Q8O99_06145 [bacterium]|nr:hypothetical protein [bacterium]